MPRVLVQLRHNQPDDVSGVGPGSRTRSRYQLRFDTELPCLLCRGRCPVILPGFCSMPIWEEVGVKRLRVEGVGVVRAYWCVGCGFGFTEVGWYYGGFMRQQGVPMVLELVKRREFLQELIICGFSWSRVVPCPGAECGALTSEQILVMGEKIYNRYFTDGQLHSMYCPLETGVVWCGMYRPEGGRRVAEPSCSLQKFRSASLCRFFGAAFYFWFSGVCSDSDVFGPVSEFFLEHISYGYRTAAEQVPDLWDDREQVPGLNSVGVVPTDPAEDSRELSWALLS